MLMGVKHEFSENKVITFFWLKLTNKNIFILFKGPGKEQHTVCYKNIKNIRFQWKQFQVLF